MPLECYAPLRPPPTSPSSRFLSLSLWIANRTFISCCSPPPPPTDQTPCDWRRSCCPHRRPAGRPPVDRRRRQLTAATALLSQRVKSGRRAVVDLFCGLHTAVVVVVVVSLPLPPRSPAAHCHHSVPPSSFAAAHPQMWRLVEGGLFSFVYRLLCVVSLGVSSTTGRVCPSVCRQCTALGRVVCFVLSFVVVFFCPSPRSVRRSVYRCLCVPLSLYHPPPIPSLSRCGIMRVRSLLLLPSSRHRRSPSLFMSPPGRRPSPPSSPLSVLSSVLSPITRARATYIDPRSLNLSVSALRPPPRSTRRLIYSSPLRLADVLGGFCMRVAGTADVVVGDATRSSTPDAGGVEQSGGLVGGGEVYPHV